MRLLLAALLLVVPVAQAQDEDELVIIPRSEVRGVLSELNRLRSELKKANDRLIGCKA